MFNTLAQGGRPNQEQLNLIRPCRSFGPGGYRPGSGKPGSPSAAVPSPAPEYVGLTGIDIFSPGGLGGDCESSPQPVFSEHITDLNLIDSLTPAGTVQGGDLKPHGFLHNKPSSLEVPVYAPADSYLIHFAYYVQGDDAIYKFKFQVSCEVAYYFDHLRSAVSEIQKFMPDIPADNSWGTPVYPPLFFQAGDLIGYTGGTSMSGNWDFGVLNTQVWNDLPPEETYIYSDSVKAYRFAVCQYQYFPESLRQQYIAMLGNQGCDPTATFRPPITKPTASPPTATETGQRQYLSP